MAAGKIPFLPEPRHSDHHQLKNACAIRLMSTELNGIIFHNGCLFSSSASKNDDRFLLSLPKEEEKVQSG
jgi:hypothetical protein